jgi:hypothetical protein
MGKFKEAIGHLTDAGYGRGMDGAKMAKRLIEAGLKMMIDEGDFDHSKRIRMDGFDGSFVVTTFRTTDEDVAEDAPTLHKVAAIMGREPRNGERIVITVDQDGRGFTTEYQGTDHAKSEALIEVATDAAKMFDGYAQLHLAKSPPDLDKADRNIRMAGRLYTALGLPYVAPEVPENRPESPAQGDLLPETGERPRKQSDAPLDRAELLAWFEMKLDGCTRNGMHDAYAVLRAFRDEVAQHLEAAPIDIAAALRAFHKDVHERNVKAGWWSDLATGQPKKRSVGELFMLFVTELWEAYDAYTTGDMDDKLPHLPGLGVELGDLEIRFADFCGALAAGKIVSYSGVRNAGDEMFRQVGEIAQRYEAIRKTPAANGDPEMGDELIPQDVPGMIFEKLEFNASRADHKPENRMKEGGKQT